MKPATLLLCLLIPLSVRAGSRDEDYSRYHGMINRAEEAMFVRGDYAAAKKSYDSAFAAYGFVFAKDCAIAAQLALVNGDEAGAMRYLHKGFEGGLRLRDLAQMRHLNTETGQYQPVPVFAALLAKPAVRAALEKDEKAAHKTYLSRINIPLRIRMDSVFIFDQLSKNNHRGQTAADPAYNFVETRLDTLYESIIRTLGFPGEKLIGIDDTDLMADLGRPELDILAIYDSNYAARAGDFHVRRNQFWLDRSFSTLVTMVPLLHNSCAYPRFAALFKTEIARGNLHPRDAAYLLDFFLRPESANASGRGCRTADLPPSFYTYTTDPRVAGDDLSAGNARRADLGIVSLEVDRAKATFARTHSLALFFGFFDHL